MKSERVRSASSQVILGVIVIALGLMFLLDNLDIFNISHAIGFWPVMFIVFGILKLADTKSGSGNLAGGLLIALGGVMVLNNLGYIHLNMRAAWPVLIILVGVGVVYKSLTRSRNIGMLDKGEDGTDSVVDATAILGGFERRISTPNFRGGEITALMGGCDLDLRGSSIEGEAVVNVFAAMGGITLKVPPDWTVILHGTPIMGGFDEKTIAPVNNNKRLIIKGYAIMGGVEVRN